MCSSVSKRNSARARPWPTRAGTAKTWTPLAAAMGLAVVAIPSQALAGPGTKGVRHMAMGEASRASAYGVDGAMNNPSGMGMTAQFSLMPAYQLSVPDLTHGLSAYVMDSLNNPRFSLALGYEFTKGAPKVGYTNAGGEQEQFELSHFGHEVSGSLNVALIRGWWWFAIKPKFQNASLRYIGDDGAVVDAMPRLTSFGMDVATTFSIKGWLNLAFVASNLVGNNGPAWTEDDPLTLDNVEEVPSDGSTPLDLTNVRRVADYPLTLAHGVSIHPLRTHGFSINFDGMYDLSSYRNQDKKVRTVLAGGVEFTIKDMVPIRAGARWDGRGRGDADDRIYASGGLGFVRAPKVGGTGFEVTAAFAQQVNQNGDVQRDTTFGVQVGLRFHPDL